LKVIPAYSLSTGKLTNESNTKNWKLWFCYLLRQLLNFLESNTKNWKNPYVYRLLYAFMIMNPIQRIESHWFFYHSLPRGNPQNPIQRIESWLYPWTIQICRCRWGIQYKELKEWPRSPSRTLIN